MLRLYFFFMLFCPIAAWSQEVEVKGSVNDSQGEPLPFANIALLPDSLLTACGALPDLVIMDLALPEMDGIEVARRIRETAGLSHVPIFIVSAYLTPEVQAEIRAAGCAEMFSKPCDFDSLLETIRITLGER